MNYAKAIVAGLIALGTALVTGLDDSSLSTQEWVTAALAVVGSAGVVWYATNGPSARYVKAVVGSLTAVLTTLLVALEDDLISSQEWTKAGVAALVGLGIVYAVPNRNTA
jgi:hypothetical protein